MTDASSRISALKALSVRDGITLRPVRLYQGEEIYRAEELTRSSLAEWMPWAGGARRLPDVRSFIRRSEEEQSLGIALQLGIWIEGDFAGVLGLHSIDWDNRLGSMGYWLAERARGRGVMTACGSRLVDYAICDLGLNRVEIRCPAGNVAGRGVAERLGFAPEGTARMAMLLNGTFVDLIIYAMLACRWRCEPIDRGML